MAWIHIKKEQAHVILAVTFGNILEWYEVYSYIFLAPVLAKLFFNFHSSLLNLFSAFMLFGIGFITRPFGAILFGRIGDLLGRKKAFILSIIVMTVPTFLMGCLGTYKTWGIYAPILLVSLRLLQSIPESGESPGTFCFLYENADRENKKFMTSWGGFGNQIGAIIGVIEVFVTERFMSEEFILDGGWRISFWFGGLIGLMGIFLRSTLHETPVFRKLKKLEEIDKETTWQMINHYKKKILLGTAFGAINASTFYFIATYIPTYFDVMLGLTHTENAVISLSILILTTILLPFFGILGDNYRIKPILIICALSIILLLLPFYYSIIKMNFFMIGVIGFLYLLPITCITAFIPYLLAHLFPPRARFTGVGLAFNFADGIIGGFTPAIAILLIKDLKNEAAFCWYILICSIISLIAFFKIRE